MKWVPRSVPLGQLVRNDNVGCPIPLSGATNRALGRYSEATFGLLAGAVSLTID